MMRVIRAVTTPVDLTGGRAASGTARAEATAKGTVH